MKNTMLLNRNLGFLLHEWLNVEALRDRTRFSGLDRSRIDTVLMQASALSSGTLAPINRLLDEHEPRLMEDGVCTPPALREALGRVFSSGLIGIGQDHEAGGMQLPAVIDKAVAAWLDAGSAAASAYLFPTRTAGKLLRHCRSDMGKRALQMLMKGEALCTMGVSEQQAGSSLADIRTIALPQPDGSFRLFGHKMWVVGGDHDITGNIFHLVLARVEQGAQGVADAPESLSLFLVPKFLLEGGERNDIVVTGLSPQMGQRGASSCLLSLGDGYHLPQGQAGAMGWLVGQPGEGLAMLAEVSPHIQLEVGMAAIAVAFAGYAESLGYARERHQGRIPGQHHHGGQIAIIQHADIRRMLLIQKSYVEGGLALGLWCARLIDEQETASDEVSQTRARHLLNLLAPVMKCWSALYGMHANSLAIQVLGCYGYTRDYPVEQLYRDNRLHSLVEGTNGVLSMEFLRDRLLADDAVGFHHFLDVVNDTINRGAARCGDVRHMALQLGKHAERFGWVMERLRSERDLSRCLANASLFMEAFGHFVIAWVWLEQVLVAEVAYLSAYGAQRNFYAGKCQAARFFFTHELPRVEPNLVLLEQMDMVTTEMSPDWF
ncbi:MAG: acyl-CoA dehydrogenase [Lautropia sp.]|nr:acyl-CoA dehydrogenase [Lautropia sp.]